MYITCTGSWAPVVANIWLGLSNLTFPLFSPPFALEPLRTKTAFKGPPHFPDGNQTLDNWALGLHLSIKKGPSSWRPQKQRRKLADIKRLLLSKMLYRLHSLNMKWSSFFFSFLYSGTGLERMPSSISLSPLPREGGGVGCGHLSDCRIYHKQRALICPLILQSSWCPWPISLLVPSDPLTLGITYRIWLLPPEHLVPRFHLSMIITTHRYKFPKQIIVHLRSGVLVII